MPPQPIFTPSPQQKFIAAWIAHKLNSLYPNPQPPLKYRSRFTLLVAVLLSANSTDKAVNRVTPALFKLAPTPQKMSQLSPKQIEDIIRPCGLAPQKSQALSATAKILLSTYKSKIPPDLAALKTLPGVGHKTASVVMVQGFNKPAFPVDTHIHRLAHRWTLSSGKNVATTEIHLKTLFPPQSWGALHLQFIYFGRQFCPARFHKITQCPICSYLPKLIQHYKAAKQSST